MWTDWVNSGYILAMVVYTMINRVWVMLPILLGSILVSILYKQHLGKTSFFDIQSGAVILQVSFIGLAGLISYSIGILDRVWSTLSYYGMLSVLLGGVYVGNYIYTWIVSTSFIQSILSWFQAIPDKLLQSKVILSIFGVFLLFPLIFYILYQVEPNLYRILSTNAIAIGILDLILTAGSFFVYRAFSLDSVNVALVQTIWMGLLCFLFAGSYFFYEGIPFSQLEQIGMYCIGGGLGIGLLLTIIVLVWHLFMQPWTWHILLGLLLGGIAFTGLLFLYKLIPPSLQTRIQLFWIWILTGIKHNMATTSAMVWGAILVELYIIFKLNTKYRIEINQGTSIQEDTLSLSTLTGSINTQSSYVYGLSFALRLEPQPPDRSAASTVFTTVLNYGEIPRVAYNASLNTLRITMKQQDGTVRVMCDVEVPLQMWFHMYIGYDHGVVDIFYNGKLVQTKQNVIPYLTTSTITMGATDGIIGDISNVRVFTEALSYDKIKKLS